MRQSFFELLIACAVAGCIFGCNKGTEEPAGPKTVESVKLVQAWEQNEDTFKADYLGKNVVIKNLVNYAVWNVDGVTSADAFAFDPASNTIYATGKSKLAGKEINANEKSFFFRILLKDAKEYESLKDGTSEIVDQVLTRDYAPPFDVSGTLKALDGNSLTVSDAMLTAK